MQRNVSPQSFGSGAPTPTGPAESREDLDGTRGRLSQWLTRTAPDQGKRTHEDSPWIKFRRQSCAGQAALTFDSIPRN